jgi:uncharacterized protein (TIGR00251 family)
MDRQRFLASGEWRAVPSWQDAVQDAPGGARLLLDVTPGAKEACFPDGFDPWRGRLGMRVQAPAQEGRANADVVRSLAAFFRHPTARVHIEAGASDRRKAVRLMGLGRDAVLAALAPSLQESGAVKER